MDDQEFGNLESSAVSILSNLVTCRESSPIEPEHSYHALQVSTICPSDLLLHKDVFGSTAAGGRDFRSLPSQDFCTDVLSLTWPISSDIGELKALYYFPYMRCRML